MQENDSGVDENDSMFEGYNDQYEDEENDNDLDALLIKVEKMAASLDKDNIKEEPRNPFLDDRLAMIQKAQALLLEARLCLELRRCKAEVHDLKNDHALLLDKRRNAPERVDDAIHCLQYGLATWT